MVRKTKNKKSKISTKRSTVNSHRQGGKNQSLTRAYYWIVGLTCVLVLFGLIMITGASQIIAYHKYKDTLYFFKHQAVYALIGAFLFWIFSKIDYQKLRNASWPLAILCLFLLIVIFVPSVGHRAGGSSRWIPLGFINFQPSELAKLAAILLAAYIIDNNKENMNDIRRALPLLIIVLMAVLVVIQPDMGTAILILATVLVMLFIGGLSFSHLFGITVFGAFLSSALIAIEPYRFKRLISFLRPYENAKEGGYQIIQSLIAMGSGGIGGIGLASSRQKFFFLPAAHTDFILAIIGEELGFIGEMGLIIFFVLLAVVGFSIAYNSKDNFAKLLASGLVLMIIIQAMINMGAAVGLLPITGIPLPLISFGGSSLITTMVALGIVASIANDQARKGVR